ncbi:hypothetical protein HAX54_049152, partial [Datura stramonium]|nr:hypothetical protein [Datura stramonium]
NPTGEATTIRIQGLMKEIPPEVGDSSVVKKCRGSRKGNKRLKAGNPRSSSPSKVSTPSSEPGDKHRDCASAKPDGQRGRALTTPLEVLSSQLICFECGRSLEKRYLASSDICYKCREAGHMCMECPSAK